MSEALITPAADATPAGETAAPAAEASAPAAEGAEVTLITPEPAQGEEAAASGQGGGEGEATQGGQSEADGAEGTEPGQAGEPESDAVQGAPDQYADFTMPEGFTLPPDLGTELTAIAKELNLPQTEAQKLIDLGVKHAQGVAKAITDQVAAARTIWADQTRSDAEIGGANLSQNMGIAKKALVAFGTPALTGLLNETGLGLHPEFLRLLVRVGDAISEDTLVDGGGGGEGAQSGLNRDHAKRLYPKMA